MKFLILLSVVALCAVDVNGLFFKHLKKDSATANESVAPAKSGLDLGALLKILAIPLGIKKQLLLSHQKKINAKFDQYIGTLEKFSQNFDKATNGNGNNVAATTDEFDFGSVGGGDISSGSDIGLTTGVDSGISSGSDIGFNAGTGFDAGVSGVGTSGGSSAFESAQFSTGSTLGNVQVGGSVSGGGSFSGGASVGFGNADQGYGGLSVGSLATNQDAVQLDIGHQSHEQCNHGYGIQAPARVQTYEPAPLRIQTSQPAPFVQSNIYEYTAPAVVEPQIIQEVQQPPTITRDYLPPARRRYRLVRKH